MISSGFLFRILVPLHGDARIAATVHEQDEVGACQFHGEIRHLSRFDTGHVVHRGGAGLLGEFEGLGDADSLAAVEYDYAKPFLNAGFFRIGCREFRGEAKLLSVG